MAVAVPLPSAWTGLKFNPHHDEAGRFSESSGGGASFAPLSDSARYKFEAMWDKWRQDDLTTVEKAAIKQYTGPAHQSVNDPLRKSSGDVAALDPTFRKMAERLDSAMEKGPGLQEDLMLTRVAKVPLSMTLPGTRFTDHAFVSTSLNKSPPPNPGANVVFQIKAPKGTRGMYVAGLSQYAFQREFILARGTSFVVEKNVLGPDKKRHVTVSTEQ